MPELPEVETIRLGLEKYLVGKEITGVEVRLPKIVKEGDLESVVGCKFVRIRRFGKALVLDLDCKLSIVVHIKLTGQLIYTGLGRPKGSKPDPKLVGAVPNRFTHVIFSFSDNGVLYYNDLRQFGWIRIVPTEEVEKLPFIHELGPESFGYAQGEPTLTLEQFREILSGKKAVVKVLLMDQKRIGGVGNIYANEALFLAKIDPWRPAKLLGLSEQSELYDAVLTVLKRGLKYGGASELTYVNALGEKGEYQKHFLVYGRQGQKCPQCGGVIKKIRLGGRGTYFCPNCQK